MGFPDTKDPSRSRKPLRTTKTAPKGKAPWASKVSNLKPKKAGGETVTGTPVDYLDIIPDPLLFESPTSSNITGAEYNPTTKELTVKFHGGRSYLYRGVPRDLWDDFDSAESKGSFFAARIRDQGFGGERL